MWAISGFVIVLKNIEKKYEYKGKKMFLYSYLGSIDTHSNIYYRA